MRLTTLVLRNIFRRRARSVLTITGVAVAVGAMVAVVGIARGLEQSMLSLFQDRGVDLVVVRAGGLQGMNSVLEEKLGERIRALPGVRAVSGGLAQAISFEERDLFGVLVRGVPTDSFLLRDLKITSGRRLEPGDGRKALLGKVLAMNLGKHVGDKFDLVAHEPFEVVGIYESLNVFENGSMFVPLPELQRIMGQTGEVNAFTVVTDRSDKQSLEELRGRIQAMAPHIEAMPTREYVENTVQIRMAGAAAWLLSTIILWVAMILVAVTMLTAVFERTRELAVLRAIGWRKSTVMRLILMESIALGLFGAVVGTLLAVVITRVLGALTEFGRLVAGHIGPAIIVQGFVIALVLGVLGGLYPAYRAAQLLPTEGLRHE
jgi:putative ABC transport system permease protein